MNEERELYWYDDATYDIGFYNYYQRTVDPSPWALIFCLSFCVILALLLPLYLSYYRLHYTSEEAEGKSSDFRSNSTSIVLGSQEFIASDECLADDFQPANTSTRETLSNLNAENMKEPEAISPERKLERERASVSKRRATFSIRRLIQRSNRHEQSNDNARINMEEELNTSTCYAYMAGGESVRDLRGQTESDERKQTAITATLPTETDASVNRSNSGEEPVDSKAKGTRSCISSESETTNPLHIIKHDLEDFTRTTTPNDVLSVASGWEEDFDTSIQATMYFNPKTGIRTTEKLVEPTPDDVRHWYLYYSSPAFRRKIRKCGRWDDEMEKIIGLAFPYTAHTIVVDVFGLLEVGIIGRLLGTSELSAYFATEFAISFATMFFHGILASLKVLVSQAHGARTFKLAATYVQIGICTHHLFCLPLVLLGWENFDDLVLRLGLDEDTAESAEQYARFVLIYEAIGIYDGALHCVLDVSGHEKYSAISNGVRAFVSFLAVLIVSHVNPRTELWMFGAIHLIVKVLFIFSNICVIFSKHWLDGYWNQISKNPFKDWRLVKTLWKASLRLSSGRVIENCEWNILFVFAAIQGPAEVAIWGLVGKLWDFAEDIVIAISDASKVRCAHLLGSGLPQQAKYSSEKSLLIGVAVSIIMALSLGAFQFSIPRWLTNDFTLQRLLGDMIPMISLAVASSSFGSICCSILCAQGRSHLATAVTGFGSLAVALPLASLSNFCFNLNLQGLVSCLIIGYASSDFCNSILMLTSNWSKISQKVRKRASQLEEKLVETSKVPYANPADCGSNEIKGAEM